MSKYIQGRITLGSVLQKKNGNLKTYNQTKPKQIELSRPSLPLLLFFLSVSLSLLFFLTLHYCIFFLSSVLMIMPQFIAPLHQICSISCSQNCSFHSLKLASSCRKLSVQTLTIELQALPCPQTFTVCALTTPSCSFSPLPSSSMTFCFCSQNFRKG